MDLFLRALVGGIAAGALYGLLAFSVVVLYKATGVANFAVGVMGVLAAFVVWRLNLAGLTLALAVPIGLLAVAALGALVYTFVIRPRPAASHSNVIVRTLPTSFVLTALIDYQWAVGQPFAFPKLLPKGGFGIGPLSVPWATLITLAICGLLVLAFAIVFNRTDVGLQLRAVAANRDIAMLLGVRYRRIALSVWIVAAVLAGTVAILAANRLLLTTAMLEPALLYAFAGAIVFGLNSLPGAILGGLAMGVVNSIISTYASAEVALISIFGLLIITMYLRPDGIFGVKDVRRV